jgi:hypothetical protein
VIHHERRNEIILAKHGETRGEKRHTVITVRRPVDRVDDDGVLAVARDSRLFTHDAKSRAVQHAQRDFIGDYIESILRRSQTRKTFMKSGLDEFADLVRAVAKWCEE